MFTYMCHAFNALDQSTIHAVHDVCSILRSRNTIHGIGLCNTFFILAIAAVFYIYYCSQCMTYTFSLYTAWYPYLLLVYAAWCHAMKLKKKKKEIKERFHAIDQCIPSVCYFNTCYQFLLHTGHTINYWCMHHVVSIYDTCYSLIMHPEYHIDQ